ncbi:hypothetical protein [Nostoc sp.]
MTNDACRRAAKNPIPKRNRLYCHLPVKSLDDTLVTPVKNPDN